MVCFPKTASISPYEEPLFRSRGGLTRINTTAYSWDDNKSSDIDLGYRRPLLRRQIYVERLKYDSRSKHHIRHPTHENGSICSSTRIFVFGRRTILQLATCFVPSTCCSAACEGTSRPQSRMDVRYSRDENTLERHKDIDT